MRFGPYTFTDDSLIVIAGPCVIESEQHVLKMAQLLSGARDRLNLQLIFKTSFDKANRSSYEAYRGVTLEEALPIFRRIREEYNLPVLTDVHTPDQPGQLKGIVDAIQVPAFLSRQTDIVTAAARSGLSVNVKKGQFLSPWDVANIIAKLKREGCDSFAVTERGTCFGYNYLVSDMRAIPVIQDLGAPAIFDATHSAQLPGAQGDRSGGLRQYIPVTARAAVAAGCDGLFLEVHDQPDKALSDAATQWPFEHFESLMTELLAFRNVYVEVHHRN